MNDTPENTPQKPLEDCAATSTVTSPIHMEWFGAKDCDVEQLLNTIAVYLRSAVCRVTGQKIDIVYINTLDCVDNPKGLNPRFLVVKYHPDDV